MKKLIPFLIITLLLTGCTGKVLGINEKDNKIQELEQKLSDMENKQTSSTPEAIQALPTSTPKVVNNEVKIIERVIVKEVQSEIIEEPVIPIKVVSPQIEEVPKPIQSPVVEPDNRVSSSMEKIAKCEAEKELRIQKSIQSISQYSQTIYTELLNKIDSADPCGELFYPDAISICYNGHASLARIEAKKDTDYFRNEINTLIQRMYIDCLNN